MRNIYWLLPLLLHSADANAWGLVTHVYFAQWLIWATPLLDPRLRQAIQRFPELVMAGACLPDLALVSPSFRHTHQWPICQEILLAAATVLVIVLGIGLGVLDEERAVSATQFHLQRLRAGEQLRQIQRFEQGAKRYQQVFSG